MHKRVLLSGPAELVSPSAMNKLGKQRQAMKGCGSRKAATETISTQEVQVENFVIRKRGGGEEGGEREAEEECTQDDLSSVADICNGQDTAARPEHTESKVAAGDCVLGNNSVTEDEGGESPSVLSNVLGVPVPITYSPCAGQPLPCEEQQQQRQAQPDLLERSGMDEEESDAHNVCEDHSSSLSMCTTLEERVSEEEVERKKVPSNCEASPVVHEKQRYSALIVYISRV